jgi:hypothetical protein
MRIKVSSLLPVIILLIVTKILGSCTPESCFEETTSFVNVTFYKSDLNKPYAPDSITVFGIHKETSKLYIKSLKTPKIKLPLDASSLQCGFVIKINDITDTIKFSYTGYPHLISKECGITFYFDLDTYTAAGSIIDTVIIRNQNITTFNEENIRIYY